jgi:hypothetical protein
MLYGNVECNEKRRRYFVCWTEIRNGIWTTLTAATYGYTPTQQRSQGMMFTSFALIEMREQR